jgi:hypothetical protein
MPCDLSSAEAQNTTNLCTECVVQYSERSDCDRFSAFIELARPQWTAINHHKNTNDRAFIVNCGEN